MVLADWLTSECFCTGYPKSYCCDFPPSEGAREACSQAKKYNKRVTSLTAYYSCIS